MATRTKKRRSRSSSVRVCTIFPCDSHVEPNSSGCKLASQEWRCHHPRDASQEWRCHHPRDTKTAHCGNLNGRRSAVRKWMQHTGNKDINLIICPGRVAYAPCAMPCYASRTTQHGPGARQRVPAGLCRNALSTLPKIHGPSRPLLCRADATQWRARNCPEPPLA